VPLWCIQIDLFHQVGLRYDEGKHYAQCTQHMQKFLVLVAMIPSWSIWLEDATQIWLSVSSDVVRKVIPFKAGLKTGSEIQ